MREKYETKHFSPASEAFIFQIERILEEYALQGYRLTIRQLYYQLVARDMIPNREREYKRVIRICNDARMAGLIDWDVIEDRTRMFRSVQRWGSGREILEAAADSYHEDLWKSQDRRVFCIVEKDALVGVLSDVCNRFDVPLLAARGYPSVTVLREFAENQILPSLDAEQGGPLVLHLGDHDPSGIDMTRDLLERLDTFTYFRGVRVQRIALNMDQIERIGPPENPAKITDARFSEYSARFGDSSWELDALPPSFLATLVQDHIQKEINGRQWKKDLRRIEIVRRKLKSFGKAFQ